MSLTLLHSIRREPKPWAMVPDNVRPAPAKLDGSVQPLEEQGTNASPAVNWNNPIVGK
ncbi:hypothetical protein MBH78_17985 [Oceanimonas sp. NS1]|nr:hypothetical protein [Oceanimonas sp. NS1]